MSKITIPDVDYPTGDGKPIAETPIHRLNLTDSIAMLEDWFEGREDVYISGNMLLYYVEGDVHRHVSPDVFAVIGIPRRVDRHCYQTWKEPKPTLDFVIEFTSKSTRREDKKTKFELYRDILGVREYVLFDPFQEYLKPSQQLFRLVQGEYISVPAVEGRLPSEVLGFHIDRDDRFLRFWNPKTREWLPTPAQKVERFRAWAEQERLLAEQERLRAEDERRQAEVERERVRAAEHRERMSAETITQLQAELESVRAQLQREDGSS